MHFVVREVITVELVWLNRIGRFKNIFENADRCNAFSKLGQVKLLGSFTYRLGCTDMRSSWLLFAMNYN